VSKRILILIVVFSLALIGLSLYLMSTLDPGEKPKSTAEVINVSPNKVILKDDFKLNYADGRDFTLASLKGKYSLIYFGFTCCPDVCPLTMQKMQESATWFTEKELEKIQFIFVSVDPSRDTPESLKEFASAFGNKIQAVTGNKADIDKLTETLKAYYAKEDSKDNDDKNYYVDHTSFIYLLNPQVELVSQFSSKAMPQEIAEKLKKKIYE
jgi:protein SCO1